MKAIQLFRFIGDFLAIGSRIAIVRKISNTQSLSGLSLKTQIIYLAVFISRYLDLFKAPFRFYKKLAAHQPCSLFIYNTCAKVVYIGFQIYVLSIFYSKLKYTYSKKHDRFNIPIFFIISAILALFLNDFRGNFIFEFFNFIEEFFYTFSLILESLAILPQLFLIQDSGECEKLTAVFITCLGLYRLNYLIYFIFSYFKNEKIDVLLVVSSIIQSILYLDFYRVYFGFFGSKED